MPDTFAIKIKIAHALDRLFQAKESIFKQTLVKDGNLALLLLHSCLVYLKG